MALPLPGRRGHANLHDMSPMTHADLARVVSMRAHSNN
jgi:hypothetical protein